MKTLKDFENTETFKVLKNINGSDWAVEVMNKIELANENLQELKKVKAYRFIDDPNKEKVFQGIANSLAKKGYRACVYRTNSGQKWDCELRVFIVKENQERTRKSQYLEGKNIVDRFISYDYRLSTYNNGLMRFLLSFNKGV